MSPGSIFFFCACAILVFSIINYKIGPIINQRVDKMNEKDSNNWGLLNCGRLVDLYNKAKELYPGMSDRVKESFELEIRKCRNRKVMYNMEHTSVVFNGVIGFLCVFLGIYKLKKKMIPKTGMIGMICGAVGFILTVVYVIYNGVVCFNYYDIDNIYKVDGDGAFAELDGGSYKCFYYNKPQDEEALKAKYCDLIKSQYNYNKDLDDSFGEDPEKKGCQKPPTSCRDTDYIPYKAGEMDYDDNIRQQRRPCSKLYYHHEPFVDYTNFDISFRFLTALILSIITLPCHCGLIFSGFIINYNSKNSANVRSSSIYLPTFLQG